MLIIRNGKNLICCHHNDLVMFVMMFLLISIFSLQHCTFASSCCRWCTMAKNWTTHSGFRIIVITYSGRSTWTRQSSSWSCPPVTLPCCGARDHRCLACVSMMPRVSRVSSSDGARAPALPLCFQYWWNVLEATRRCRSCVPGMTWTETVTYLKNIYIHMKITE